MNNLSPEAKELLAQLRSVDDPSPGERSSGDAAVRRMLESQGLRNIPPLVPQAPREAALAARSGTSAKIAWVVGAACVATLGFLSVDALRSSRGAPGERANQQGTEAASRAEPTEAPRSESAPTEAVISAAPAPSSKSSTPRKQHERAAHSTLADELRFVASVDADIRAGNFDRALHRLEQHKALAVLQEERTAMRVLALCGVQDSRGPREREHFLEASPTSVLAARVRAACAGANIP